MSKSINLEQFCLQMNSMWQYMDIKLQGSLSSIMCGQKCPSNIMFISDQQLSLLANKTCTIYTVAKDVTRCQHTLKSFFSNYTEKELSHAEKENIYWQIRLRYACGIIPVAVVHMISKLRECGYTNWILPNSMTIPLDDLCLISFAAIPNDLHVIKSVQKFNGQIIASTTEAIEPFSTDSGKSECSIGHNILGVIFKSGEKYVIDPTSLQFGIRGQHKKLIYSGSWDEYCQIFPGHHIELLNEEWKLNVKEVQMMYELGNHTYRRIDELVAKSLRKLCENSCHHCGEFQAGIVSLLRCAGCKEVYYCDKFCQKSDWKFHKTNC